MGCDIHAAIEHRDNVGEWHAYTIPNKNYGKYEWDKGMTTARVDINRDYDTFSILANVRNYEGGFVFISDERGLPEDISSEAAAACDGDHSDTWVSLTEILEFDWTRIIVKDGVVNAKQFEEWDRLKEWEAGPRSYCGGVSGLSVRSVDENEMRAHVDAIVRKRGSMQFQAALDSLDPHMYTRITWNETYAHAAKQLWVNILPTMLFLGRQYGQDNVRLVMNFDS